MNIISVVTAEPAQGQYQHSWVIHFCHHRRCAHPDINSDWVQSCWAEGICFQLCCHADATRISLAGGPKVLQENRSCGAQTRLKTVGSKWGRGTELTMPVLWWALAHVRAELHPLQEQCAILHCHSECPAATGQVHCPFCLLSVIFRHGLLNTVKPRFMFLIWGPEKKKIDTEKR